MNIIMLGLSPITSLGIAAALRGVEPAEAPGGHSLNAVDDVDQVLAIGLVDLVIVDPMRPSLAAGLARCRDIKLLDRAPTILAFCGDLSGRDVALCQLSGIDSLVTDDLSSCKLAEVVNQTLRGFRVWLCRRGEAAPSYPAGKLELLTPREQEVLWMVADRLTNSQIASSLGISTNTVKNHAAAVLRKLGVSSRAHLYAGAHSGSSSG